MARPDLPPREPGWATDSSAVVTDPGTSKQSTGWISGEAPAADHYNWLMRNQARWLEYLADGSALNIAAKRMRETDSNPFSATADIDRGFITYDRESTYWYASLVETIAGNHYAYDSADGQTWSTGKLVDTSLVQGGAGTRCVTNGTKVAVAADNTFYLSSDLTVANLSSSSTFNNITRVFDLVWSPVSSRWIATGWNGTSGYIESSTNGTTWTTEVSAGAAWYGRCFAQAWDHPTSASGERIIATNSNDDDIYYSDDGGLTWSSDSSTGPGTDFLDWIYWSSSHQVWFGIEFDAVNNDKLWCSTDSSGLTFADTGLRAPHFFVTDSAAFYVDENDVMREIYYALGSAIMVSDGVQMAANSIPEAYTTPNMMYLGSRGAFGFPRDADGDYIYTDFRPEV